MQERLLDVLNLSTNFHTDDGVVCAVNNLSFQVNKGESVCIVGESGCGKSVTSMSIMRLLKSPPAEITGQIQFEGKDLLKLSSDEMCRIRGNEIAMIFQEPMTALNPLFTCGYQISEVLRMHQGLDKRAARKQAVELMRMVGIPIPEKRVNNFPHQLSGGMRQRAALVRTLILEPDILLLDEPFSALDYQTRLRVGDDIGQILKREKKTAILVTHDLSEAISLADRIIILTSRPATVQQTVPLIFNLEDDTPLNRRNAQEFKNYFSLIWKELNSDA